jgi:hypothetical protein
MDFVLVPFFFVSIYFPYSSYLGLRL